MVQFIQNPGILGYVKLTCEILIRRGREQFLEVLRDENIRVSCPGMRPAHMMDIMRLDAQLWRVVNESGSHGLIGVHGPPIILNILRSLPGSSNYEPGRTTGKTDPHRSKPTGLAFCEWSRTGVETDTPRHLVRELIDLQAGLYIVENVRE